MSLEFDAILAFGSLGFTILIALGIRIGFRPRRDIGER